ncbi:hypothetical protein BC826DRAFT_1191951 [Russula brevipes]|nr:hypothetical protein BC826DRAFT_1191951 [Russula brevipes]
MMAETPSDVTSQPIACDTMSRPSIPEDAGTSAEILSTSFPATTNNKAQGSSMAPIDLNYLDGPTIIDEPSESLQVLQAEKSIAISKPAVEVIDFLTDTPSPMPSASEGEKIASSRNVPTSSPSSLKGRTSDDITPPRSANARMRTAALLKLYASDDEEWRYFSTRNSASRISTRSRGGSTLCPSRPTARWRTWSSASRSCCVWRCVACTHESHHNDQPLHPL